ncbi:MAG: CPBP family intramembrane metalloprotease [Lachnospiraceae bacterium]|nr:CPBP family intramembrane metalloprotease [Lachnospiraceae bacterium]
MMDSEIGSIQYRRTTMTTHQLKNFWYIIVPTDILFALLPILIKNHYGGIAPISGLVLNYVYQFTLIAMIVIISHDYIIQSAKTLLCTSKKSIGNTIIKSFLLCFIINFIFNIAMAFIKMYIHNPISMNQESVNIYREIAPIATSILSIIIAPFTEEMIFRGFIYHTFQKYGVIVNCIISSSLFSFVHLIASIVAPGGTFSDLIVLFIQYLIPGISLFIIREKYNNICINYTTHMLWNFMMSIIFTIIN